MSGAKAIAENMPGNGQGRAEAGYGERLDHLLNDYYVFERDESAIYIICLI